MAKVRPVKIGILGLGRIGWNHHINLIRPRKDYEIVAVADPLPERRAEAEKELGCKAYPTLASMLKKSDAEMILVATRSTDHAKHTLQCLKAGKHVLVEKPAAMNLKQMDQMLRLARRKKLVLTVHQNNRFSDHTLYLKEIMKSGILGEVYEIKITGHSYQLRNDWQTLKKNGGGHLFNHGTHWIDAAIFLMGAPVKEVWGDMKHLVAGGDAEDYFKVILRDANGCLADVEMSMAAQYKGDMFMIMGTRGTLTSNMQEITLRTFKTRKDPRKAGVVDTAAPGRAYGQVIEKIKIKEKVIKKIPSQKVDFYGNIVLAIRKRARLIITPESVREQLRVLFEARASAAKKKGKLYR